MRRFWLALTLAVRISTSQSATDHTAALALDSQILNLSELSQAERQSSIRKLATQIVKFPVKYSVPLATNLAIDGIEDGDQASLQLIANTLARTLRQLPPGSQTNEDAFENLAELVLYGNTKVKCDDFRYQAALATLKSRDRQRSDADFTLNDINGTPWNLKQLRGKVVLVNFWATWCPPCRAELPDLNLLYERFQRRGLVILAVSGEERPTLLRFLAQNKLDYPVLLDPGDLTKTKFLVPGFPESYVYNRHGHLVAESIYRPARQGFLDMLAKAGLK